MCHSILRGRDGGINPNLSNQQKSAEESLHKYAKLLRYPPMTLHSSNDFALRFVFRAYTSFRTRVLLPTRSSPPGPGRFAAAASPFSTRVPMKTQLCSTPTFEVPAQTPESLPLREVSLRDVSRGSTSHDRRKVRRTFRRGPALKVPARTSRTVAQRTVREDRIKDLWDRPIEYVYHKSFDNPALTAEILGPAPETTAPRLLKAPQGLPAYLASLYEVPLLTREQEAHHFRKYNYLKYQAAKLRKRLNVSRVSTAELDRLEKLLRQADDVKNLLIRTNLRLVVAAVKKYAWTGFDFSELVSDGNISLMRALEKFDFSRGFKFSTYAVWAIRNNFSRSIFSEHSRRERFRTGLDEVFSASSDMRSDEYQENVAHEQRRETVHQILQRLSERERDILACRFGLRQGSEPLTLEQVGAQQGVTKERIRQLEKRAIYKLQELAIKDEA